MPENVAIIYNLGGKVSRGRRVSGEYYLRTYNPMRQHGHVDGVSREAFERTSNCEL
jgi:hypothetical protein